MAIVVFVNLLYNNLFIFKTVRSGVFSNEILFSKSFNNFQFFIFSKNDTRMLCFMDVNIFKYDLI